MKAFLLPLALLLFSNAPSALAIPEITNARYDEVVANSKLVIMDFNASWCPHCQNYRRVLNQLYREDASVDIYSVDIDYEPILVRDFNITAYPTTIIYKNGKITSRFTGEANLRFLYDRIY